MFLIAMYAAAVRSAAAPSRHFAGRLFSSHHCDVCIVGGGMVGAATAKALVDQGLDSVRVISGSEHGAPSSSNDVTRMVGVIGAGDPAAADASVRGYRELEKRSGISFWSDAGVLQVVPARGHGQPYLERGQEYLTFEPFFDESGYEAHLTEPEHGFINPRLFTSACRQVAEHASPWLHGCADSIDGEAGDFVVSTREGDRV